MSNLHIALASTSTNSTSVTATLKNKQRTADLDITITGEIRLPIIQALGLVSEIKSSIEDVCQRSGKSDPAI